MLRRAVPAAQSERLREDARREDRQAQRARVAGQHRLDRRSVRRWQPHEDRLHPSDDHRRADRTARSRRVQEASGLQSRCSRHVPGRAGQRARSAQHVARRRRSTTSRRRSSPRCSSTTSRRSRTTSRRRSRPPVRKPRSSEGSFSWRTKRSSDSRSTRSFVRPPRSSAVAVPTSVHRRIRRSVPSASVSRAHCPVLNSVAVDYAIKAALALGCRVQPSSIFARKNYFYPDLPKGYQISQYERPLALGGGLDITVDGASKHVGLTRIHMEEDAGKSLHEGFPDSDRRTYVDYNRSGVPLIEIVSEPDMRSAAEAAEFFSRLRDILVWLDVSDGNMEEGSLRCDANVSVRPVGPDNARNESRSEERQLVPLSSKRRLEFEIERQIEIDRERRPRHAGDAPVGLGGRRDRIRCAARKKRTTTGTFRSPICRRWSLTRHVSRAYAPRCRNCPRRAAAGSSSSMRFRRTTPACSRSPRRSPTTSRPRPRRRAMRRRRATGSWARCCGR